MDYIQIINRFTAGLIEVFGTNLVGIYVHGSIAMRCFNWNKSDIDLLVVVNEEPDEIIKKQLMDCVMECNDAAPSKGLEMSIVLKNVCSEFIYPTPFILHYSNMHREWYRNNPIDYCKYMKGEDKDLAAHFMIIKNYGITWWGTDINLVFGEVKREYYLDSIKEDINNSVDDIMKNPMYIILNLCRVAAYTEEGLILSKEQGGNWGVKNLPQEYSILVAEALDCYLSNKEMSIEKDSAIRYSKYLLQLINKCNI